MTPSPAEPTPFLAQPACAAETGTWCANVYDITGNDWLAASANWLIAKPLTILIILIVAVLLRFLIGKLIDRVTRPPADDSDKVPALLRPLRERANGLVSAAVTERRRQRAATLGSVLKSVASIVIFVIAGMQILATVGVNLAPVLASAGIVGVALAFGAQSLVSDFLSGMFMMAEDQYGVGDYIDTGEAEGTVEAVGLRVTTLRDLNGTVWYVRNGEIVRTGNYTQHFSFAVVDVPLPYATDVDHAKSLLGDVANQVVAQEPIRAEVVAEPEVMGVSAMTPENITLRLMVKTRAGSQWMVQRALQGKITNALAEAGFERPLPRIFGPHKV